MSDLSDRLSRLSPEKRALLARQLGTADSSPAGREPLAIVGMGCRFPGGASSPHSFWRLIWEGRDAVETVPAGRWEAGGEIAAADDAAARWGAWLDGIEEFDSQFFGLAPRECERMDPQQRLVLEVCWEALEDAGQTFEGLAGSRTGVYVGTHVNDYAWMVFGDAGSIDAYASTGTAHSVVANRVSYLLDLRGPSLAVDTACSSSLVAVHLACQALRQRECDLAVACGVNLLLSPLWGRALAGTGMLSPEGRCRTFDARADGIVRGEGCGSVVLKRLSEAVADGDPIWAVIRGTATNQDGRTNGLTAPNGLAQQAVLRAALANAGVEPAAVSAVEAHGTGTALGDPIEVEALAEVLGRGDPAVDPCVLGSVKTNVGHLEGAAGIAGLIKLALCLHHEGLPRLVHFEKPNPLLPLEGTRFVFPGESLRWPRAERPRVAGVSAFGFGGMNAHAILAEAPSPAGSPTSTCAGPDTPEVLVLSARSPEALARRLESVGCWLTGEGSGATLSDVCFTAWSRRSLHPHGVAVAGSTRDEIAARLSAAAQGASGPGVARVRRAGGRLPGLTFVFSGQGTQWPGMALRLRREAAARDALDRVEAAFRRHSGWSLVEELERPEGSSRLSSTEIAQPAIFAVQVALAACWREMGIVPEAVVGHSVGEVAAAHVAGILSLDDAARVIIHRGRLMESTHGRGRMLAVQLHPDQASALAEEAGVALAAVNGPTSCVLSGDGPALEGVAAGLEADGVTHRWLAVDYAFHSAQMDTCARELPALLAGLETGAADIPVVSTVSGALAIDSDFGPDYWARNVRQTVRFAEAVETLGGMGHRTFVELGPHPALLRQIGECAAAWEGEHHALPSLHRDVDDGAALRCALGALRLLGYGDGGPWAPTGSARTVRLPGYPWHRERYPLPRGTTKGRGRAVAATGGASDPLLGRRLDTALETWELEVSPSSPPWLGDHRILGRTVYPAAALLASTFAAGARLFDGSAAVVEDLVIHRPLELPDDEPGRLQISFTDRGGAIHIHGLGMGNAWSELASARVKRFEPAVEGTAPPSTASPAPLDGPSFYSRLAALGAEFGPAFHGVESLWPEGGRARAQVTMDADAVSAGIRADRHPPFLDACLQVAAGALLEEQSRRAFLLLPVAIERAWCEPRSVSGLRVEATARDVSRIGTDGVVFDLRGRDDDGRLVLEVTGLHLRAARAPDVSAAETCALEWVPRPVRRAASAPARQGGRWLLLADEQGVGEGLARALEESGERCDLVRRAGAGSNGDHPVAPDDPAALRDWLRQRLGTGEPWRGIIHLWALDEDVSSRSGAQGLAEATQRVLGGALSTAQALVAAEGPAPPPRLWLVGRGACAVAPGDAVDGLAPAAVGGFTRVVALEHPALRSTRIDLDPAESAGNIDELLDELLADDEELEVAFRHGRRFVSRVRQVPASTSGEAPPQRLERSPTRLIEELNWVPAPRRPPGPGEVEVRVLIAGLNFRDVLNALGLYPGPEVPLGNECVGEVVDVGPGVEDMKRGDVVLAVAFGSFGDYVTTPASLVAPKPAALSMAAAATIPIAYLTAYFALHEIGKLAAGERVLVHAGAGGVGLAAIHLARRAGAEVFATAGSEEKRAFLRRQGVTRVMDSRSLSFGDEVREATAGRGVDVVLNSLSGEFIEHSFAITASGGRFLELGKRDIWSEETAADRRPDVGYHVVYLGDVCDRDPERVGGWLRGIVDDVLEGELAPLPCRVFGRSEAGDAFRHMAQARHIGKVALELARTPVVRPAGGAGVVRPGSTQLVTGGLGGVGLVVADWLSARGAGALALVGRSAPRPEADAAIERIRARGTQVEVIRADVTSRDDLAAVLQRIESPLPPLAGVWHAAGIVDDATLEEQDSERLARTLAPKAVGAWNLHELTEDHPLDAFVLFSSAASLVGWPGQANYASANAVLDALAHHRHQRGLPALSVNWGAWSGEGMAARLGSADRQRLERRGLRWLDPEAALETLEAAWVRGLPQVGILSVDWSAFSEATPSAGLRNLLSDVASAPAVTSVGTSEEAASHDLAAEVRTAPASRRRALLTGRMSDLIVRTLGLSPSFVVDPRLGLRDIGLDSLMAVELRNSLQSLLGRPLPSTLLFDHPTLESLGDFLLATVMDGAEPHAGDEELSEAPVSTESVSEDEAEELLRAELAQMRTERHGGDR